MKKIFQRKNIHGKKCISNAASDYISNTNIHGLGYLGAKDKNIVEKIWWLLVFTISLIACVYLISQTWIKWAKNPVVISFSTTQIPVSQIPFPAVTICPANKINRLHYNFTLALLNYRRLYGKWLKRFLDIALICDLKDLDTPNFSATDNDVYYNIYQASPSLRETIPIAMWRWEVLVDMFGHHLEFHKEFELDITEEGLCFTFNSLNLDDLYTSVVRKEILLGREKNSTGWSLEDGYTGKANVAESYPVRAFINGAEAGLRILLRSPTTERENNCGPPLSGYKIYLHNPAEPPRINEQHILLADEKFVVLSVTPRLMTTSQDLRNLPPHTRNCYFTHEKHLMYYRTYTQTNCRLECTANLTKELCKCLPFYMPREHGVAICALARTECFNYTTTILFNSVRKTNVSNQEKNTKWYKIIRQCDCLPSCTLLEYQGDTSEARFHFTNGSMPMHYVRWFKLKANDGKKYTRLNIFFKDASFLATNRSPLFTQTDFFSNCGGLLGLCMGFSILSLFEIVYFLTIRIYCKLRKSSQHIQN